MPDGLNVGEILVHSTKEKISESIYPKMGYGIDREAFEKNQSIINYLKVELNLERNDWLDTKHINHLMQKA